MIAEEILEKPAWLKIQPPKGESFSQLQHLFREQKLHTVCEEAHCPNQAECWSSGTATFMVLGRDCTRACKFCAVSTVLKPSVLDPEEPRNIAQSVKNLGLNYVVITSVNRDDLPDHGSSHIAACIQEVKKMNPGILVEVLIPDFQGNIDCLKKIIDAQPEVLAHNLETVQRLQKKVRDLKAGYEQSLSVLHQAKILRPSIYTKSSLMLGLGESEHEVVQAMEDLRNTNVDILTLGQYLRPGRKYLPVEEYIAPERFQLFEDKAYQLGFLHVASGPLVRSSYRAGEAFMEGVIRNAN